MCVIVLVKELLTTNKKWFVFTEFRYNKRRINKWSEIIGRRHRKSKSGEIRWLYFQHNFNRRGSFNDMFGHIGLTCSLELVVPGIRVVSIEETSVWGAKGIVIGGPNFPFASRAGNTVGSFRKFAFFDSTLAGTRATLFRFCWYSAIASGLPRNVGNAYFGLCFVVRGSTGALVSNTFVLFFIAWISSSILWFVSANKDKSVGNDSDSGWGKVDNTWYVLKDVVDTAIGGILRHLNIKFKLVISN